MGENQSKVEEERNNCINAYTRMLDIYKLQTENYFKRTQVLMVAIQAGLFVSLTQSLSSASGVQSFPLPIVISILGAGGAWVWSTLSTRQGSYLELCRCYLRNLEYRLEELGVPLTYHIYERKIFNNEVKVLGPEYFLWSKDQFPYKNKKGKIKKVKGRLVKIETSMAHVILVLWLVAGLWISWHKFR